MIQLVGQKNGAAFSKLWEKSNFPNIDRSAGRRAFIRAWFNNYGAKCLFCGRAMFIGKHDENDPSRATIDHINCTALGGTDAPENLQVICQRCNGIKARLESELALQFYYTGEFP